MTTKKTIYFLIFIPLMLCSFGVFASGGGDKNGQINTPEGIKDYIKHHIADSHDFLLFSYTNKKGVRKHIGFPLPVIIWTSGGLKTFMSSEFEYNNDGKHIVTKGGVKLVQVHSKIYELNKNEDAVSFDEKHHPTNAHKVFDLSITKNVTGMLLIGSLMLLCFSSLARGYKKRAIPKGFSRILEPLVIYVRDDIARPNIGDKHYRKFMGFLLTVFFFIWMLNLSGLTPLSYNVTGNIAVTVCLALFTFFIVQFNGKKPYWKHIFWMPGVPIPIKILLIPLEVLGMFTKPFALLIRLFANMTAGHVVVMSLISLMITMKVAFGPVGSTGLAIVLALFVALIELLVAFLQAFIFTMLSSLFIGMAVAEPDHH